MFHMVQVRTLTSDLEAALPELWINLFQFVSQNLSILKLALWTRSEFDTQVWVSTNLTSPPPNPWKTCEDCMHTQLLAISSIILQISSETANEDPSSNNFIFSVLALIQHQNLATEDMTYLDDGQLDNPYSGRVSGGNYTEVITTKERICGGWSITSWCQGKVERFTERFKRYLKTPKHRERWTELPPGF